MKIKQAKLINWDAFLLDLGEEGTLHFDFYKDDEVLGYYLYKSEGSKQYYRLENPGELLGHRLYLKSYERGEVLISVLDAVDFPDFDKLYFYEGDDLGATYYPEYTSFKLWAPLANEVTLVLNEKKMLMKRKEKGIFSLIVDGDYDEAKYYYLVNNDDKVVRVVDPYAKSSSFNATYSNVIDLAKIEMTMYDETLPPLNSYLDAIIYEANVRDMTSDKSSDILNKGKFLGLIEKNRKTKNNNPAGFDYLVSLGFTHLQLMPVQDFNTKDELDTEHNYNWGYDPVQYFALEGSYSTEPNNPYSRMIEFKKVVRDFHRYGIRVNLDVVYNHVYEGKTSIFNKVVPNYYFRRENGQFMNHSYCGSEVASERAMARKLIIDSLSFLVNVYHVDGFRFDLMGLLDVPTMNMIAAKLKAIDPNIMLYGEGWDMCSKTSDGSKLATMYNANELPDYAFFNDQYRNIVRGSGGTAFLDNNGYMLGNTSLKEDFKYVYAGSCFNIGKEQLFTSIKQSLNYFECHDNATLFDVIKNSTQVHEPIRLVKKMNKLLMLSFGIPFVHAGQEIALSKFKHSNTYNEGDKFNKFSYDILDERFDMVTAFKAYIKARKELAIFHIDDLITIDKNVDYIDHDDILEIKIKDVKNSENVYHIYINPTSEGKRIKLGYVADFYFPKGFKKNVEKVNFTSVDIAKEQLSVFIETKNK